MDKLLICANIVAILINLILPHILKPLATKKEIKPPNGAGKLSFKEQIMHMLVHHKQVMITSSLIVALLVGLSTFTALKLM